MRTSLQGLVLAIAMLIVIAGAEGCDSFRVRVLMKEANELYTAQKYEEAVKKYQQILLIDPKDWDANYDMSVAYLALYHPGSDLPKDKEYQDKGLAAFEKTLALQAPSPEIKEKTEKFYLSFLDAAGDKPKAIAYLEKQLQTRPSDMSLINQIANLYMRTGDFPNALKYFQMRADKEPRNKEAWYTVGVNCWARSYKGGVGVSQQEREEVVDRGIKALEKALEIDPNYFDALSYINLLYREQAKALAAVGKNKEAADAIVKADDYFKRATDVRKGTAGKTKST